MNNYTIGQQARIDAFFTAPDISTSALVASDPTEQTISVKNPFGVTIDINPERKVLGNWFVRVVLDEPGVWEYRWEVTQPFVTAAEGEFFVDDSNF